MIHMTEDFALTLGLDRHVRPVQAITFLAAERADSSGVAEFDQGELFDLIQAEVPQHKKPSDWMREQVRRAMHLGYLDEGSTNRRLVLPAGIRVSGR